MTGCKCSRGVVAFPDVDGFSEWKEKLSQVRGLDIMVSDVLEKSASSEDRTNHVDIADLLIRQHRKERIEVEVVRERQDPLLHPTFLKLKGLVGVAYLEDLGNLEELALLVAGLDLEVEGVKKF